ncbi:MAG: hypothetical protein L3J16_04395, partial [Anaerolineales bacterium]|nr:hypothetical protein [Anaerolineales bacterium]
MSKKRVYNASSGDWLDRLARMNLHFGRFISDVFGVLLLAFALISLLALFGFTQGTLLTPWVDFLALWFGLGKFLIILSLGMAGLLMLRRSDEPLPWGRLMQLELAIFLTLSLLAVIGGRSIERAELGLDGGRLGWGLDQLFLMFIGPTWSVVVTALAWLLAVMSGFRLWQYVERWLLRAAGEAPDDGNPVAIPAVENAPEKTKSTAKKKRTTRLPPEFRKSFEMPERQDDVPAKPRPRDERLPPLGLLLGERTVKLDERTINQTAGLIEKTLAEFGIPAQVTGFRVGPAVTQFAVEPGFIDKNGNGDEEQRMKVRVAQIASLRKDLALALSAQRLRIEAPVPGRSYVGIEVPNSRVEVVRLRAILETAAFQKVRSPLAIAMGRDVSGRPVVADLAKMPHLLIAGTTGSGKSVGVNAMILSLIYKLTPEQCRFIFIDPKMLELSIYDGIPHLIADVVTSPKRAAAALQGVVRKMEERYQMMSATGVRNIDQFNEKARKSMAEGEEFFTLKPKPGQTEGDEVEWQTLPYIVVVIDELADLMMSAAKEVEESLQRLAQMARAAGIHLVLATQRPSVDVLTGVIKA